MGCLLFIYLLFYYDLFIVAQLNAGPCLYKSDSRGVEARGPLTKLLVGSKNTLAFIDLPINSSRRWYVPVCIYACKHSTHTIRGEAVRVENPTIRQ